MFEPAVLAAGSITRGLVFVDTDHGFNLGYDPSVRSPHEGVLVARLRGDAHDRELYERWSKPPTYRYRFSVDGRDPPQLVSFSPPPSQRIEAEAEWPAALSTGSAYPIHFPCASGGRALRLLTGTSLMVGLPAGASAPVELEVGWVGTQPGESEIRVAGVPLRARGPGCSSWRIAGPAPGAPRTLVVELARGEGALDFLAGVRP